MLNWLPLRRRRKEADAAQTSALLAGGPPRSDDDEATLRVVRALQPAIFVPEDERRLELDRLLRAAEFAERTPTGGIPARQPDSTVEPTLHLVDLLLGRYPVVLVDVEEIDEERVEAASAVVSHAIVDHLSSSGRRQRDESDG